MKRLIVRISVLAILVVLGLIAIAQAQRDTDRGRPLPAVSTEVEPEAATPATDARASQDDESRRVARPLPEPRDAEQRPRTADLPGTSIDPFAAATLPKPLGAPPATPAAFPSVGAKSSLDPRAVGDRTQSMVIPVAAQEPIAAEVDPAAGPALTSSKLAPTATRESNAGNSPTLAAGDGRYASADQGAPAPGSLNLRQPSVVGRRYATSATAATEPTSRYGNVPSTLPDLGNQPVPMQRNPLRTVKSEEPAPMRLDPRAPPAELPALKPFERTGASVGEDIAAASNAIEGNGQPGKKQLEGPQAPQLTIQKFAPDGVQVGKTATFRITVINSGQVIAHGVEIRDVIPKGTQLMATKPQASRGAGGELVWPAGTMKPGDEVSVEMQVMPVTEGEIGSVATVRFNAEASARTVCTRPELIVKTSAPGKVMIGDSITLNVTVTNPGTGVATGVTLIERIPAGLQHANGPQLEYEVGTLKPGESQQLQLPLTAVQAGMVTNILTARGDGSLKAEDRLQLQIVAPKLDIAMDGPRRRYLEREATYVVSVSNPGTAPARQIELVAFLPRGLKFVSANNAGQYVPDSQTVHWTLEELPAADSDKVELVTLPIEAGEQKIRLEGKADKGLAVEKEQSINVEGIAAVLFEVANVNNPIEVGGETVYEIRVVNQGSKAASNVRLAAILPPGMRAVAAEGPTRHNAENNRVQFESLARLAPKADTTYRVRVQGLQPGDMRVRVQLQTDEMQEPVTKEESTRVYKDE